MLIIKRCLDSFCSASGLKVSLEKKKLFCSHNTNHVIKEDLSRLSGFMLSGNLGKYLGLPLHHNRVNRNTYQFVVDKVRKRLSVWKLKKLAFAGRATLVQSVLNTIAIYYMQSSTLPLSICDEIDRISRSFLWGSIEESKKHHLVARDNLIWPKKNGGLGIKSTRKMNIAFMMKLGWELVTRRDKLWVQILRAKYKCGDDIIPRVEKRNVESNAWRGIRKVWKHVLDGIKWHIGDGSSTNFWTDVWLENEPLAVQYGDSVQHGDLVRKVSSYVSADGDWNWVELRSHLPTSTLMRLASVLPPCPDDGDDRVVWKFSKDHIFTVNSAYKSLEKDSCPPKDDIWHLIWKWDGPQRIKSWLWLAVKEKLLTNVNRMSRGMCASDMCQRCDCASESNLHALRDCNAAQIIWKTFVPPAGWDDLCNPI